MKSINRRFHAIQAKKPDLSSIICFNEAVYGQGFSGKNLYYHFPLLVDKDDYDKSDKKEILSFIRSISKRPEEGIKQS